MTSLLSFSCNHDDEFGVSTRYPDYVNRILKRKCADKGCHTTESAEAAAGLNLESWQDLFRGSRGGSAVVPYSPEQSYLLYSINVDEELGPTLSPTMPLGKSALSRDQYLDLRQWILEGARNEDGEERFPPRADRRKWYSANQGCDLVAVFDADSKQIMRYVEVGRRNDNIEEPHDVVVSPDGTSWYVVFNSFSSHIEQYSTLTDEKEADIDLGYNGWNYLSITPDGKYGFAVAEYLREIVTIDLQAQQKVGSPVFPPTNLSNPSIHPTRNQLYLLNNTGDNLTVYEYNSTGQLSNSRNVDLIQGNPNPMGGSLYPSNLIFLPDGSKYYVSCWGSQELRVYDGSSDLLLGILPIGAGPLFMAYSNNLRRLFVSCSEDTQLLSGGTNQKGLVMAFDVDTDQGLGMVYSGYQPSGMIVDEAAGLLLVNHRNTDPNGPADHHASTCQGRNGYLTAIDLFSFQLVADFKSECSVDPYDLAIKH